MVTADDVRAFHESSLGTLTQGQRSAISRIDRATALSKRNGKPWRENLDALFEAEAERCNCAGEC